VNASSCTVRTSLTSSWTSGIDWCSTCLMRPTE
jgi:hypothetical protein